LSAGGAGRARHGGEPRQKYTGRSLGGRRRVLLPELQLARQAHGRRQGLRIVDPHAEAERGKEPAGEQLDPLRLIKVPSAGE
jgi:hypothetical protein